jgi:hypothetical protein
MAGIPRNFEVFDPLDFLAEVTQHIPNKGEHQIRYYGWYSNRNRGLREKDKKSVVLPGIPEPDNAFRRKYLYFSSKKAGSRRRKRENGGINECLWSFGDIL